MKPDCHRSGLTQSKIEMESMVRILFQIRLKMRGSGSSFPAELMKSQKEPFEQLQADSLRLSKEYRSITAEYAEKCGWYHLLRRTEADIDMKQALQGWKQTVKRIGKGTGKTAPALKAKARELMSKCQVAVPCWIMPISRALESLNPKEESVRYCYH
mgnify:CR=1 FL=1